MASLPFCILIARLSNRTARLSEIAESLIYDGLLKGSIYFHLSKTRLAAAPAQI